MSNLQIENLLDTIKKTYMDKATGELTITFETGNRYIYFINGNIRYARSEFENERVGQFFLKDNLITEEQLEKSLIEAKNSNKILGEYLKENGLANGDLLREAVKKLIVHISTRAFTEEMKTLNFQKQQQFIDDSILLKISTGSVLLEGTRMIKDTFVFENFLTENKERVPVLTDNPGDLFNELHLTPHEGYIMSRIDKVTSMNQIASITGIPELDVSKMLYALNTVGIIYFKDASMNGNANNEPNNGNLTGAEVSKEKIRDEAIVEGVERFYRILDKANHYDILEVSREASAEDIKKGYIKQIKKFHPDKHSAKIYFDITGKLETITDKVTQAHNTLSDKEKKERYDHELKQKDDRKMRNRDVDQKEQIYQNAMNLLRGGRHYHAITMFQRGIQIAPNDKRFNLELGKLLSHREESAEKAKYYLKKVLKIDPSCIDCYLFLARMAKKQGNTLEAKKYFTDLATFDPTNKEAEEFLNGKANDKKDILSSFKGMFGKKNK